jgi:hypothetical protein
VIDAAVEPTLVDAAPVIEPPAVVDAAIEPPRPSAPGFVVVQSGLWCNIYIDGKLRGDQRGDQRNQPIDVTPGRHTVRCVNPAGEWRQDVDVPSGATKTVTGSLQDLEVTLDVDATIDGKPYDRGSVVKLKRGNVEVIVGGKKQFIPFRASCTLRDTPELGCYLPGQRP